MSGLNPSNINVTTFACPRIGSGEGTHTGTNGMHFRVSGDVVPQTGFWLNRPEGREFVLRPQTDSALDPNLYVFNPHNNVGINHSFDFVRSQLDKQLHR